ncbi:MAG: nicotinate-nucleotide adenylyltransferase [Ignavibacterium sp.]
MSKIGIFGGSFDPIHLGHLIIAQFVYDERNLDKIIFIPSFISPHKMDVNFSNPKHRLEMIKLAIKDIPYFDYSDFEIKKEGISYTIDTLKEFKKNYDDIDLIIGYDNLLTFDKWKNPDEILKLAKLIVLRRETTLTKKMNKYFDCAIFLKSPIVEISSTEIRERVAKNKSINFLITKEVKEYIFQNNLYTKI